jgi:mRNA interferase YafQ
MSQWMIFGLTWELIDVLNLKAVSQFKKDFKKYRYNEAVLDEFEEVVDTLRIKKKLIEKYLDHPLTGNYNGMRECHIKPDVLLIYWISEEAQTLYLERIGSHSELFR